MTWEQFVGKSPGTADGRPPERMAAVSPQLRVLPSTAEAMAMLGKMTIAELLGTYEHNLDERDELLHQLIREVNGEIELTAERDRELFKAWCARGRRLELYRLLANELDPLT